jgi:hypothetical protein
MFFLMRCLHHEGQDAARDTHRPSHRAWVQSGGEGLAAVLIGSALVDEGGSALGNFASWRPRAWKRRRLLRKAIPSNVPGSFRRSS